MVDTAEPPAGETLDQIAADLAALRASAGHPSYADIVRMVAERRMARGVPAARARPARTTVYGVFQEGRTRVNAALVGEVAGVLGASDEEVARWEARCHAARARREAREAREAEPQEPPALPEPEPAPAPAPEPEPTSALRMTRRARWLLLAACVGANLLGRVLVDWLGLPLHLDMTGTATAAILLGPWWGALVGVATNGLGVLVSGWASLPFAAVNVVGALVWGYGVHRYGMGRTIRRFLALCVLVALACTAVAAPILVLVFDGATGHGTDLTVATFQASLHQLAASVLSANILFSLVDKLLSGFVALAVLEAWTEGRARERDQAGEQTTTGISRSVQD